MDNKSASELLQKIQAEKSAGGPPVSMQQLAAADKRQASAASRDLLTRVLLTALGAGAAIRGAKGLTSVLSPRSDSFSAKAPPSSVDMPVLYSSKEEEKEAIDAFDNPYTLPGLLLGAPLAFYGGWKGVDALVDKQRRKKVEDELSDAKEEYRKALLGSYKQSSDNQSTGDYLDACFEKKAFLDRLGNLGKGLALTYGIGAPLAAYAFVDSKMKNASKRKILEKALRERARRRALQQPSELYAIPVSSEEVEEKE